MCEITGFTHCGLSTIARILSCLTRCVVSAQEILNTVCGIGLHSILPKELADGLITLLVNSMISLKLDIMLEEEE